MHATTAMTANPAVERTCAKSRAGRSLLRSASQPISVRMFHVGNQKINPA
jgi:hypothetical protein